jgi:hypothetical protein
MEGHTHGACRFDEVAGRRDVHLAPCSQYAQNYSSRSGILCQLNVAFHRSKFAGVVKEVPAAWADHAMDWDCDTGDHLLQQAQTGGDAATGKLTAELDAIRSATVSDLCVVKSLNANLEFG